MKLENDIRTIRNSNKIYAIADKTTKICTLTRHYHKKLLKNYHQSYHQGPKQLLHAIDAEARDIASSYHAQTRAQSISNTQAYITLKDHKDNSQQKVPCRLINPCKSDMGVISKTILHQVNSNIRYSLRMNQWKDTNGVLQWLSKI